MKTRIISGLIGTVFLFAVLLCPWTWVFTVLMAVAAAIAVWELLHNTGFVTNKSLLIGSVIFAALEVVLGVHGVPVANVIAETLGYGTWEWLLKGITLLFPVLYLLFTLVSFLVLRTAAVWKGFGLTVYAAAGFMTLAQLRQSPVLGLAFVLLPLVIAWVSDIGAYFVGTFLGKHKMAPVISPKKSWEGFFGGWVFSVVLTAVYGLIVNVVLNAIATPVGVQPLDIGLLSIMALVLAPMSVLGDLLASLIKRRCDIKDYGNIIPGHGGVMDRFDSVVFIAPMVFVALMLFA